ncbi:hypothetical protein TI05_01980 [Achromatium sp. WMS3]|nr:hypothetical protein TI05_01980 [Achromatium sp. WMS3]
MTEIAERFIPYRNAEIIDMLCQEGSLDQKQQQQFRDFCTILESLYHFEFHAKVKALKNYYHPFDPDQDTKTGRIYSPEELQQYETKLVANLSEVLNDANYEQLTEDDLNYALKEESLFPISLEIDFADFASYMIQRRGDVVKKTTIKKWFFWKQEIEVPTYERVVMLIKFKDSEYFATKGYKEPPFDPGSMVIKLFKNIPKADLEMLFPNAKVKMRLSDKLIMGVPAIGGAIGIFMKTGAGLIAFIVVLMALIRSLFHGGEVTMPNATQFAQIVGGITALGAIIGFVVQQWTKYKTRKIEFLKTLGDSLYFKNLDNNAGVFHHIIDTAEEEECKEAILGYYFLLKHPDGLTEAVLDHTIEQWFATKYNTILDFEVDDALRKLKELELCTYQHPQPDSEIVYQALSLENACIRIDTIWDNYFQYNV